MYLLNFESTINDEPSFYQYIFIYLYQKNIGSRKTYGYNFSKSLGMLG